MANEKSTIPNLPSYKSPIKHGPAVIPQSIADSKPVRLPASVKRALNKIAKPARR